MRPVTLVGQPVGRWPVVTTSSDWVIEVSYRGKILKRYVNSSATKEDAINTVLHFWRCRLNDIDWIKTHRRHEVETCISPEEIVRSKIRD